MSGILLEQHVESLKNDGKELIHSNFLAISMIADHPPMCAEGKNLVEEFFKHYYDRKDSVALIQIHDMCRALIENLDIIQTETDIISEFKKFNPAALASQEDRWTLYRDMKMALSGAGRIKSTQMVLDLDEVTTLRLAEELNYDANTKPDDPHVDPSFAYNSTVGRIGSVRDFEKAFEKLVLISAIQKFANGIAAKNADKYDIDYLRNAFNQLANVHNVKK